MSALMHTLSLLLAIVAAFVWLNLPSLTPYSLQIFALTVLVYLVVKRLKKASFWHVAPGIMSVELALLTFAFLLLIGYTGDIGSVFFALSYVHLFLLVFSAEVSTAIITTVFAMVYYYALATNPTEQDLATLASLPIVLFFFIFAKAQYQQASREREELQKDEQQLAVLTNNTAQLQSFLVDFLKPKLEYLTTLLSHPDQNKQTLQGQLTLLQVEIEKMVVRWNKNETKVERLEMSAETTVESQPEPSKS